MSDTNPVEARWEWEKKGLEGKLEKAQEALRRIRSEKEFTGSIFIKTLGAQIADKALKDIAEWK